VRTRVAGLRSHNRRNIQNLNFSEEIPRCVCAFYCTFFVLTSHPSKAHTLETVVGTYLGNHRASVATLVPFAQCTPPFSCFPLDCALASPAKSHGARAGAGWAPATRFEMAREGRPAWARARADQKSHASLTAILSMLSTQRRHANAWESADGSTFPSADCQLGSA
jgi:hypothetical protein